MVNTNSAAGGQGLLAQYGGEAPPAPAWFGEALAMTPERSAFEVDGVPIELLTWGQRGKPGLLFLHGDSAHAEWWSFIAPYFAADWRCAAISWSGMGNSGRRKTYAFNDWSREALAAIDVAELDQGTGTMLVAHSLGGYPALGASAMSDRVRGVISLDSAIAPAELIANAPRPVPRPHKLYPTLAAALARFRLMPDSDLGQHYILDFIARKGLTEREVDGQKGWNWKFDPEVWADIDKRVVTADLPGNARCPLALLVGEQSPLLNAEVAAHMRGLYPQGTPFVVIPSAAHHIMIDQPLGLVATLRSLLACWPQPGETW